MIPDYIGTRDCIKFRNKVFDGHLAFSKTLEAGYMKIAKRFSYVQANQTLLRVDERLRRHDLNLSMDDDSLRKWCQRRADQVQKIIGIASDEKAEPVVRGIVERYGISFPDKNADLFGIAPSLRRCACEKWWRRQVRVIQARECDEIARNWRLVHNKGQIYCSHHATNLRRGQKVRNRRILKNMVATNDDGQEFSIAELADLSVSNPKIRRSELMVRMRGFEDMAEAQGHVGEFYTITCPSKYHSTKKGGIPNEKFNGATVREASDYLVSMWGRVRAALHRGGVDVYGFRVAEPNHDGCPHWHMLLFMRAGDVSTVRGKIRDYALAEDGDEAGAQDHRFKVVPIDKEFGSATGYIAKYISKNIDGQHIDEDLFGHEASSVALRIEAWASTHGIRQFQQIGGASVTVWRELRRLDSPESGIIEEAREAADSSDWAAFCLLMGSGRGQAVALARWQEFDANTGEIIGPVENRYGEPAAMRVFGVVAEGVAVLTRFYRWTIKSLPHKARSIRSGVVDGFDRYAGLKLNHGTKQKGSQTANDALASWFLNLRALSPPLEFCQ